jgi:MFS family permease
LEVSASSQSQTLPGGLSNAYAFAMFNALSFQVVLSSPMILYAKSLGASATVLGIITGMMPLLVILQIPAAQYVERVGYRRFVLMGWSLRVGFIFGMALVPLTAVFLDANSRLALLLLLLFGFNLSRGISSAAWLPWIASLVPEPVRGQYLVREAAAVNLASCVCFVLSALCLSGSTRSWQFAVLFGFSATMGAVSLLFLKRIPDVTPLEAPRGSREPVPWTEMLRFDPFRRLLGAVTAWSVGYGGLQAFTVAFLRGQVGWDEGTILLISSVAFLGGLSSLGVVGGRLDRFGSKPTLELSVGVWVLILVGWLLLAGRVLPAKVGTVVVLHVLMGLFASLVQMANTRLAMAVIPAMGRTHFFALYSVLTSLALGLSPIGWGMLIDAVGRQEPRWLGLAWNGYAVFFAAVAGVLVMTLLLVTRLKEPKAARMEALLRDILIHTPQRVLLRLWPR